MIGRVPWQMVWKETVTEINLVNDVRGYFPLPTLNLFATFRVVCPVMTVGSVTVKLRFGFTQTDAANSPNGINFPAIATSNGSVLASVVFDPAAIAPGCVGSPPGILPPICAVLLTTGAAMNGTFQVHATMLSVEG